MNNYFEDYHELDESEKNAHHDNKCHGGHCHHDDQKLTHMRQYYEHNIVPENNSGEEVPEYKVPDPNDSNLYFEDEEKTSDSAFSFGKSVPTGFVCIMLIVIIILLYMYFTNCKN